ncbi:hypothetical protein EG329_012865 [Mollisiaceae sp. DMI_Dod_QoI]|nr:hypothetical protein EG329_012865 [Helotiales sp. DMI_Dod_QoI]
MEHPAAFMAVDMNNPSNLSLGFELVRFQGDLSRTEFWHHDPDNQTQRTLQSLAHGLGLEYEYCLRTREARIVRLNVHTSPQVETSRSRLDQGIASQELTEHVSESWLGIDENLIFTGHPDRATPPPNDLVSFDFLESLDFSTDDIPMEEFDWTFDLDEQRADKQIMESSELREPVSKLPGLPNGQDLLQQGAFFKPVEPVADLVPYDAHTSRNLAQSQSYNPETLHISDEGAFEFSSNEMRHGFSSTPAIHDPPLLPTPLPLIGGYEDLSDYQSEASLCNSWQAESRRGSRPGSGIGGRVWSSSSSIGTLNSDRARGRASSIASSRCSRRSRHQKNSSTKFQELVFDANPSRDASTTSTSSRRHKSLDSISRAAVRAVKAIM